jgi:hypothetical protein
MGNRSDRADPRGYCGCLYLERSARPNLVRLELRPDRNQRDLGYFFQPRPLLPLC